MKRFRMIRTKFSVLQKTFFHKLFCSSVLLNNTRRALVAWAAYPRPDQGPKTSLDSSPTPSCLHKVNMSFSLCAVYFEHSHIT